MKPYMLFEENDDNTISVTAQLNENQEVSSFLITASFSDMVGIFLDNPQPAQEEAMNMIVQIPNEV